MLRSTAVVEDCKKASSNPTLTPAQIPTRRCPLDLPFSRSHARVSPSCSEGGGGGGSRVKLDVVIYNTVMSLCADAGEWRHVLRLLKQMTEEDGIKPDRISFDCLMKACGNGGDWEQALVREEMPCVHRGRDNPLAKCFLLFVGILC